MAGGQPKPRLRGWKAIGGKSRRYSNAKGESISRREYENRLLRKKGWKSRYEAEKFRRSQNYREAKRKMQHPRKGKPKTLTIFDDYARFLSEVDWDIVETNWDLIHSEGLNRDNSPDGLLAQNLVLLGLRSPEWEWDVGETPAGMNAFG